jgi:hypothetical protein
MGVNIPNKNDSHAEHVAVEYKVDVEELDVE